MAIILVRPRLSCLGIMSAVRKSRGYLSGGWKRLLFFSGGHDMSELQNIEDKIKSEWNVIRAWIATHQTISMGGAIIFAWLFGHLRWPV